MSKHDQALILYLVFYLAWVVVPVIIYLVVNRKYYFGKLQENEDEHR